MGVPKEAEITETQGNLSRHSGTCLILALRKLEWMVQTSMPME